MRESISNMKMERSVLYLAGLLHGLPALALRGDHRFQDEGSFWKDFFQKERDTKCSKLLEASNGEALVSTLEQLLCSRGQHPNGSVLETAVTLAYGKSTSVSSRNADSSWRNATMQCIFESLNGNGAGKPREYRFRPGKVVLDHSVFPVPSGQIKHVEGSYQHLWAGFLADWAKLPTDSLDAFLETLLSLLETYLSFVPADTGANEDVSLFDHSKTVASLALGLHDFSADAGIQGSEGLEGKSPFLLVGGDVSGIQTFIYDIVSKGAAKNLKGRSFYLQLLVDSILDRILGELELYRGNVVYASGGSFFLLAPNTSHVKTTLDGLRNTIEQAVFKAHGTNLSVALERQEMSLRGIHGKPLSDNWRSLIEKLNLVKRRKFSAQVQQDFDFFFSPSDRGGLFRRDRLTNEEIQDDDLTFEEREDEDTGEKYKEEVSRRSLALKELGRKLRETEVLVASRKAMRDGIEVAGLSVWQGLQMKGAEQSSVYRNTYFNRPDAFLENKGSGSKVWTFYGGNDYPVDPKGEVKTFDQLAGNEAGSEGMRRLGVLRMDVDNLGQAFVNGFEEGQRNLARYSTLSKQLDFFFKGFLNHIWEADAGFKAWTFIVYSGGDDLFVVGKWDEAIRFAEQVQKQFLDWTCRNPRVGLSGGVAIVSKKFPIMRAAALSGEAEDLAKGHVFAGKEKNALTLMGVPLNWEKEYPLVDSLRKKVRTLVEAQVLNQGFLNRIATLAEMEGVQKREGSTQSWRWMAAYAIGRIPGQDKDNVLKEFLESTKKGAFTDTLDAAGTRGPNSYLQLLNLACRLAELEMRTN